MLMQRSALRIVCFSLMLSVSCATRTRAATAPPARRRTRKDALSVLRLSPRLCQDTASPSCQAAICCGILDKDTRNLAGRLVSIDRGFDACRSEQPHAAMLPLMHALTRNQSVWGNMALPLSRPRLSMGSGRTQCSVRKDWARCSSGFPRPEAPSGTAVALSGY